MTYNRGVFLHFSLLIIRSGLHFAGCSFLFVSLYKFRYNGLYDVTKFVQNGNDFGYHQETLFWKRTGEFFIHDERYGSEQIVPLTYSEAQSWAEEHLDGDDYIAIFGEPNEDAEKVSVHYLISAAAAAAIKQGAAKLGITQAEYIERLAAQ